MASKSVMVTVSAATIGKHGLWTCSIKGWSTSTTNFDAMQFSAKLSIEPRVKIGAICQTSEATGATIAPIEAITQNAKKAGPLTVLASRATIFTLIASFTD